MCCDSLASVVAILRDRCLYHYMHGKARTRFLAAMLNMWPPCLTCLCPQMAIKRDRYADIVELNLYLYTNSKS
uniref:Uncharacterized protein n=2 Tax=Rhizophora mucronata TaxID=61149 RepID=A0A2P2M8I6_RHIMU